MKEFISKYKSQIGGVISGFDRLVFRGSLRSLVHERGMKNYLWHNQVLLKEFGAHAERSSIPLVFSLHGAPAFQAGKNSRKR
jgi:hypothetical protein